jgi:hypothetical protein
MPVQIGILPELELADDLLAVQHPWLLTVPKLTTMHRVHRRLQTYFRRHDRSNELCSNQPELLPKNQLVLPAGRRLPALRIELLEVL